MTVFRSEGVGDRSNVTYEHGRIVRYDKSGDDPSMRHIDYGLAVLTPEALEPWGRAAETFDLSLVYQRLIDRDGLAGFEVSERFYEIGSIEGLEETRSLLDRRGRTLQ